MGSPEPTPDTAESELTGDGLRAAAERIVRESAFTKHGSPTTYPSETALTELRAALAAPPNREAAPREGAAPDAKEEAIRALVEWPGLNWSDVNSTVLLDYLRYLLVALDAARREAVPGAGLDVLAAAIDRWTPQHSSACAAQDDEADCICGTSEVYMAALTHSERGKQ